MSSAIKNRSTNWLGLASTVGLFIWFSYWFKNEPNSLIGQALLWGPLVLIHVLAILAARRRFGWLYLIPLGAFWVVLTIAISGGIGVGE